MGRPVTALRSLVYALIFYPATVLWVLIGVVASLFGGRATLAIVLSWAQLHHWLVANVLAIRIRVEGHHDQRVAPGTSCDPDIKPLKTHGSS